MNPDKSYNLKLTRFLDALSDFSDQELQEAIELIRAAGKDPEKVTSTIRKKLSEFQKAARSHNSEKDTAHGPDRESEFSGALLLFFDEANSTIQLSDQGYVSQILKAEEIFPSIAKRSSVRNRTMNEIMLKENVKRLRFSKFEANLVVEINILQEKASINFFVESLSKSLLINLSQCQGAILSGYIIHEYTSDNPAYEWFAIEKESIDPVSEILAYANENNEIPLQKALSYVHGNSKRSNIRIGKVSLDFAELLNSTPAFQDSKLFVRELYEYQKEGLKWLLYCCMNRIGCVLADDMGLGKTAQIVALIALSIEKKLVERILIVVPGTLIENWRREFHFFAPALTPFVHHGPRRTGLIEELFNYNIVITSYSLIVNDIYLFNKIEWDLTICDEASQIKNSESERRNAIYAIQSNVRIAITGTPMENSLLDLWSIVDFVNPGFLGSREEFAKKYIRKNIESTLVNSDLEHLRELISIILLRRTKEDVLKSLPDRIDIHQALVMDEGESILYDNQRKKLLSRLENEYNAAALKQIIELRQFTTHPHLILDDSLEFDIQKLSHASAKFRRTVELLDEIKESNEKVLIFTEYRKMIDIFARTLADKYNTRIFTIDGRVPIEQRQKNIDLFSASSGFSVMLLNPKTAGMGLNITAANHVIHFTRQWNPALEEQASARAYRNGQKKGVNIYYLFYIDTIEEIIDERLKAKKSLSGKVIETTNEPVNRKEFLDILHRSPLKK